MRMVLVGLLVLVGGVAAADEASDYARLRARWQLLKPDPAVVAALANNRTLASTILRQEARMSVLEAKITNAQAKASGTSEFETAQANIALASGDPVLIAQARARVGGKSSSAIAHKHLAMELASIFLVELTDLVETYEDIRTEARR